MRARDIPKRVNPKRLHKILSVNISKQGIGPNHAGISEKDIQPAISSESIVDNFLDSFLVRRIKLSDMNIHSRVGGIDLGLVRLQVRVVKVADVDCFCPVGGELVRRGTANP